MAAQIERDESGAAVRLWVANEPAWQRMPLQRVLCERPGCREHLTGRQRRWCSETCRWMVWDAAHPRRGRQAALPGESRVERLFAQWIDTPAGQYVETEVARLALEDYRAGDRRGEINLYLALVRRASRGLTKDREGYACNNSYRAHLARRLMAMLPELRGFFRIRDLRGRV